MLGVGAFLIGIVSLDFFGYADLVILLPLYAAGLYLTAKYMRVIASGTVSAPVSGPASVV